MIENYKVIDKIIVVDNSSTDDSYTKLKKVSGEKIEIIKTPINLGYAYGNNYGIKWAIDLFPNSNLIISNPDIIIQEDILNSLINVINSKADVSVLSPTIKENGHLNRGWRLPSAIDELLMSIPFLGKKYRLKKIEYSSMYYNDSLTAVDVVSGCFFIIKSAVIKDINYLDENTFLYYEENILAAKLKKKNYKTFIANDYSIVHNHSVSINKSVNEIKKYKMLKQSQKYYLDNYCNSNFVINGIIKIFSVLIILNIKIRSKQ